LYISLYSQNASSRLCEFQEADLFSACVCRWLKEHPEAAKRLMDILTDVVIDYTSAQVDAGADMIQVRMTF